MAFESTNAILGIRGMEEQKKSNRWSKLMDIANVLQNTAGLGADIWKTISGRKHELGLASTTHGYNLDTLREEDKLKSGAYSPGGYMYNYGKESAGWGADAAMRADQEYQKWLYGDSPEAKTVRDGIQSGKMDEATAREQWLLTPEGQRYWAQEQKYKLEGIAAGTGRTADETRRSNMMDAINSAFETAQWRGEWFIPDPKNPNAVVVNPATIDQLRANIMRALEVYDPTEEDMAALTPYIEDLLSGNATAGATTKKDATVLAQTQPDLPKQLEEIKKAYTKIFAINNAFAKADQNPAQAQKILGDAHVDMYNALNELDDITGLDPEDLAAIKAEKTTKAIESRMRGETQEAYNQRVKNEYVNRLTRRKELIDTILQKYNLLNELFTKAPY